MRRLTGFDKSKSEKNEKKCKKNNLLFEKQSNMNYFLYDYVLHFVIAKGSDRAV
jgi:hypothetical protein